MWSQLLALLERSQHRQPGRPLRSTVQGFEILDGLVTCLPISGSHRRTHRPPMLCLHAYPHDSLEMILPGFQVDKYSARNHLGGVGARAENLFSSQQSTGQLSAEKKYVNFPFLAISSAPGDCWESSIAALAGNPLDCQSEPTLAAHRSGSGHILADNTTTNNSPCWAFET
jgi:hypothetical protein